MKTKLSIIVLFFITSFTAFAADGWYSNFNITFLYVHGNAYLIDTNSTINDCGVPGRFTIKSDTPLAKQMYATALAAYSGGKKINVFADAAQGCLHEGMIITLLGIHN